jgi:hypothetical protein
LASWPQSHCRQEIFSQSLVNVTLPSALQSLFALLVLLLLAWDCLITPSRLATPVGVASVVGDIPDPWMPPSLPSLRPDDVTDDFMERLYLGAVLPCFGAVRWWTMVAAQASGFALDLLGIFAALLRGPL